MADTNYAAAVNYALEQKLDAPVAVTDEAQQREIQKQKELATLNQSINNLIQERIAGKGRQYATQASTGLGSEINSEFESDMLNNPYTDNVAKWGKEATDAFYNEQQRGITERGLDVNTSLNRSFGDRVVDTSFGIAKNTEGMIADLVNAGIGLVNPEAGANLSKAHENFQNSLDQAITSDARQASRRLMADRQRIQKTVNKKLTEDDIASGTDEFTANMRAFGREAMNTMSNLADDSDYAWEAAESAIGSYAPSAIISGGIGALGTAAARMATKPILEGARNKLIQKTLDKALRPGPNQLTNEAIIANNADKISKILARTSAAKNAERVESLINKGSWSTSIGLMEGGTTYSSINQDIMSASTKQLYENSPEFAQRVKELQDSGLDKAAAEKQAQVNLARSTAAKWATVAGVAGAGFGALTKGTEKFVKHPFTAKGTIGERAIKTPLFEALEEIPQEGGQSLYQNLAAKTTTDKNKALYEGVGEGAVLGGFGGIAGAHTMAAPGILTSGLASTAKETGKAINTATAKVAEIRQEKDESKLAEAQLQKSQESFGKLDDVVTTTKEAITKDTTLSNEEKTTLNEYVDKTVAKAKLSEEEKTKLGITEDNRFKAISDLKKEIASTDDEAKLEKLVEKYDALTDPVMETLGNASDAETIITTKAQDTLKSFKNLIELVNPTEVTSKQSINTNKKILEVRSKRKITHNIDFTKDIDYSDPSIRRDVNTAIAQFAINGNIFDGIQNMLPDSSIDVLFSNDNPVDTNGNTSNNNNNNPGSPATPTNNTNGTTNNSSTNNNNNNNDNNNNNTNNNNNANTNTNNNTNANTNNNANAKPTNNTPSKEEQEKARIRQNFSRFLSTLPKETANAFVAAALASKMAALSRGNLTKGKKNKEGKRVSSNILYMHKGDPKQLTGKHYSAEALVQDILKAKLTGDKKGFNTALTQFNRFVETQQNKYKALLNSAKNNDSSETYQTIGVEDENVKSKDPYTWIDSSKLSNQTNSHTKKNKHGRVWFNKKSVNSLENAFLMQNDLLALTGIANVMYALAFDKYSDKDFKITQQPIYESPLDSSDIPDHIRNAVSNRKSNYEDYFKRAYSRFFDPKYLVGIFNEIPEQATNKSNTGNSNNIGNTNNGGNNNNIPPTFVPVNSATPIVTNPSIERYKGHNNPVVTFGFKVKEKVNSIALGFKNPVKYVINILSNQEELEKNVETMDRKHTIVHWQSEKRKNAYKNVLTHITEPLAKTITEKAIRAMGAQIPADSVQLNKYNEDRSIHDKAFYEFFNTLDPKKNNKDAIAEWNKKNPAPVAKNYGKTISIKDALLSGNINFLDNRSAMNKLAFFIKVEDGKTLVNATLVNAAALAVTQTLLSYNRRDRIVKDTDASDIFDLPQGSSLDPKQTSYLRAWSYQELADDVTKNLKRLLDITPNTDVNTNYTDGVLAGIADSFLRSAMTIDTKEGFDYALGTSNESKGKFSLITKQSLPGHPIRYIINPKDDVHKSSVLTSDELTAYRDGIIDLLSMEREETDIHTDDETVSVNHTYQNSPSDQVKITEEEAKLLENRNNDVYKINPVTAGVMENTTNDFWHEVQGIAISENAEKYGNVEDIENTRAKQKIHEYAMDDFHSFLEKAKEIAYKTGKPILEIGRKFSNRITLPGRVLQIGRATYVGNKTTRELFSNTPSTIDLANNDVHQDVFTAALAQALGVSIQNFHIEDLREYVDKIRSSEAFERFRQRFSNNEKYKDTSWGIHPIEETKNPETGEISWKNLNEKKLDAEQGREIHQIMTELGVDTTKLSFMALMEILRYEDSLNNSPGSTPLNKFFTNFYIEPDGINNGSANSRLLSSASLFTARQIRLYGKVGIFLGKSAKTRRDIKDIKNQKTSSKEIKKALQEYDDDIYVTNANNIPNALKNFLKRVEDAGNRTNTEEERQAAKDYQRAFNRMTTYVAWFGSGIGSKPQDDPNVDPEQNWIANAFAYEFKRAFTKPFSQTLGYGIGLTSMSRNVIENTKKNLYSFLTKVNIELNTNTVEFPTKGAIKEELNNVFLKCSGGKFNFDQFNEVFADIINNKMVHTSPLTNTNVTEERFYTVEANFKGKNIGQQEVERMANNFREYTMSDNVVTLLTNSLANSFGEVINQSARETLGESYLKDLQKTVETTNAAALMYITVWRQKYAALTNGGLKAPTKDELKALDKELKELLPVLHTKFHNFITIKTETEKGNSILTQTGKGAEQTIIYNRVNAPTVPGVSILPNGTIGMGDAVMMLLAYTKYGAEKMSDTYDGGQSALDVAEHNSYVLNRAVYDAMQAGNVFQASKNMLTKVREVFNSPKKLGLDSLDPIYNTFVALYIKSFYENDIKKYKQDREELSYLARTAKNDDERKEYVEQIKEVSQKIDEIKQKISNQVEYPGSNLSKVFLLRDYINEPVFNFISQDQNTLNDFKNAINIGFKTKDFTKARNLYAYHLNNYLISLEDSLQDSADYVDAQHRAIERFGMSVNQMAGLSRDTVYHSDKDINANTPQEEYSEKDTLNTLNKYQAEELAKIKNKRRTASIINANAEQMNKGVSLNFDLVVKVLERAFKGLTVTLEFDSVDEKVREETLAINGVLSEYKFTAPQLGLIKLISNCPAIKNNIADITFGSSKGAFEAFLKKHNVPIKGDVVTPFGGIHIRDKSKKSYIYINVEGRKAKYAGLNLLHELLHASTIGIADMYFGKDHNKVPAEVKPFIKGMRQLLMDFAKPGGVADELIAQLEHTSNVQKNQVVNSIEQIKSALYPKDGSAPNFKRAFLEYIAIANTQESIVSYLASKAVNTKAEEDLTLYQKAKNILDNIKKYLLKLILGDKYSYVSSYTNYKNLLDQVMFNTAGLIGASENLLANASNNTDTNIKVDNSFNPMKFPEKQDKKSKKDKKKKEQGIENDLNPEETTIVTKNEPGIVVESTVTKQTKKKGKTKPEQLELPIQDSNTSVKTSPTTDSNKDSKNSNSAPKPTSNPNPESSLNEILGELNDYCSTFLSNAYNALMGNADSNPLDQLKLAKMEKELSDTIDKISTVFSLTDLEKEAFSKVFSSLYLDYNFNTSAKAIMQEIHSNFLDNIDKKNLSEGIKNLLSYENIGGDKYSTAAFIALAIVNKEIKDALSNTAVNGPKKSNNKGRMNQFLDNLGYSSLYRLMNWVTNSRNNTNQLELLHSVLKAYYKSGIKQSQKRNYPEGLSNKINSVVVEAAEGLSDKVKDTFAKDNSKGFISSFSKLQNTLLKGAPLGEVIHIYNNILKVPEGVRSLISDLIGNTSKDVDINNLLKLSKVNAQQLREQFRNDIPRVIKGMLSRELTKNERDALHDFSKIDIGCLSSMNTDEIMNLFFIGSHSLEDNIYTLEEDLKKYPEAIAKSKQLAHYMLTGEIGKGMLYRNATLISIYTTKSDKLTDKIDQLTTLYAINQMEELHREELIDLYKTEKNFMKAIMGNLAIVRQNEINRADANGRLNQRKGFMPTENQKQGHYIMAPVSDYNRLKQYGYVKIGEYPLFKDGKKIAYFYSDLPRNTTYSEGVTQTASNTTMGVRNGTGFTTGLNAGFVLAGNSGQGTVTRLTNTINKVTQGKEGYIPIFQRVFNPAINAEEYKLVGYEMAVDTNRFNLTQPSTDVADMIGIALGRDVEEKIAKGFRSEAIKLCHELYEKAVDKASFINVYESKDPIIQDSLRVLDQSFEEELQNYTWKGVKSTKDKPVLMIRRSEIKQVLGERNASIRDFWSGNTRWSEDTQKAVRNALVAVLGTKAFSRAAKTEAVVQSAIAYARNTIVVKSIEVCMINMGCNLFQMNSLGVPFHKMPKLIMEKYVEMKRYMNIQKELMETRAKLGVAIDDPEKTAILNKKIKVLSAQIKELTIAPLIEAGEFSTVTDAGTRPEEIEFMSGKLGEWLEQKIDKLPEGVKELGEQVFMTKNTALYRILEEATQFQDFIAKAIVYDHVKAEKIKEGELEDLAKKQALAEVREEFVDYDKLAGRDRQYLENIGMLWFYNYKLRIIKSAVRNIRRNPFNTLVAFGVINATGLPMGLPITDNLFAKILSGDALVTVGPQMGLDSWKKLPAFNLIF